MATSIKSLENKFPKIKELNINRNKLFQDSSTGLHRKYQPIHKKINSANNPESKFREYKNLNSNHQTLQSQTLTHTTVETPEIPTRYKSALDKLNTNISSLRNKYEDLIKKNFSKKEEFNAYKMRFLKLKKEEEEKKKQKIKQEYLFIKNMKMKLEQEKSLKLKEEIKEKRLKEFIRKKKEVQKLKIKEKNDLENHKINLIRSQMNKKRLKEEEKQYIEKKLNMQKDINLKERINKKRIKEQKEQIKAERIQGNKIYFLKQIEKDLESKIKVQNTINNKINNEYLKYVRTTVNDECVKDPDIEVVINPNLFLEKS